MVDFQGTPSNDVLTGTLGDDRLFGYGGNDLLDGNYGFDLIDGGAGIDTTTYAFYNGGIIANLQTGVVRFPGNSNLTDTLVSIENLIGSSGSDTITGSDVDNVLEGGYGNDSLSGGYGNDTLRGGEGNDILDGGYGFDTIDGGNGTDTTTYAFYNGGINANLQTGVVGFPGNSIYTDTLISIENLIGSSGSDTITGSDVDNVLEGGYGNDSLSGGYGNDTLRGGEGNDILDGGYGFDTIDGGNGTDTTTYAFYNGGINANLQTGVVGFPGNSIYTDTLISIENLIGSSGSDTITGSNRDNVLEGGYGNDSLIGGLGNDTLVGGDGSDRLNGYGTYRTDDSQFDKLSGGAGTDYFVLGGAWGVSYVESGDGYAVIQGWNGAQDYVEVKGSLSQYSLEYKSVSGIGSSAQDTEIYFTNASGQRDRIAIIEDSTNIARSSYYFKVV